jgi:hypothetical protein
MLLQRRVWGLAAGLVMVVVANSAHAASLNVLNPGFELPGPAADAVVIPDNWVRSVEDGYPDIAVYSPPGVPEGVNAAYMFSGWWNAFDYTLTQQLSDVLTADTVYTLQVDVGCPNWDGALLTLDYRVDLLAGNTVVASDDDGLTFNGFGWQTSTVTYTALADNPDLGQPLTIRLVNKANEVDDEVDWDNVRLDASPVPEPTSLLLAASLFGLGLRRIRRSK